MTHFRRLLFSSLLVMCSVCACTHSHVIQVTVTNTSNEKVSNIVIDYPEATFGINVLDPGKSFAYRIKPTDNGPLKIQFLNSHAVNHTSAGPMVHKNDEGSIEVKVTQDGAVAEMKLSGN